MEKEAQATKEEINESKRKCWHTECNKTALIETNGGWRWCWKHFWWQRDGYFSKMKSLIWKNIFK